MYGKCRMKIKRYTTLHVWSWCFCIFNPVIKEKIPHQQVIQIHPLLHCLLTQYMYSRWKSSLAAGSFNLLFLQCLCVRFIQCYFSQFALTVCVCFIILPPLFYHVCILGVINSPLRAGAAIYISDLLCRQCQAWQRKGWRAWPYCSCFRRWCR